MSDPGRTVVDHIYSTLQIDAQWSVRGERGFTWWGKDYAQRVWAEPPFVEDGLVVSRLHARTDVVRGFSASREKLTMLASLNKLASLNAFVWDAQQPDRVALAAGMYVHDQNLAMVQRLFSFAVAMQAADAHRNASVLAFILGAECDVSAHPGSGLRTEADDMLKIVERGVLPEGRKESRWPGKEMEQAVALFSGPPCVLCTGDENGLAAEFPLAKATTLLTVNARATHPLLGSGLLMRLFLPFVLPVTESALEALRLNSLELQSLTRAAFLGSWCLDAGGVNHVSFYPNCIYLPGLLPNLVLSAAVRARWVAERAYGHNWNDSYAAATEQKVRQLRSLSIQDSN